MPALNHPLPHTETLANGLRVSLRHAPHLKRCAAALRVSAGSHDVPPTWPGLAHFLEHLFFLGTERFPAEQGLMAYVQNHGGQVNARTCERTTDFFFELPPQAFAEGLARLCDMLGHPRLDEDDQLREREVLHAEFIAWSRDATAQRQFALFDGLAPDHPLRAFHAGNRYSLTVPRPAFQQALREFYQTFYRTGQMTLSLAGPQSIDELRALAERFSGDFAAGECAARSTPPALLPAGDGFYQQADAQRLDLLFAAEQLPEASSTALAFLCTWLESPKAGGLIAELKHRKLIEGLKATVLYQFAGQALLHLEFNLSAHGANQHTLIRGQLMDWLGFFSAQADWPALREEYALLQQRKQQVAGALALARLDSEALESELSAQGVTALKAVLKQLQPAALDAFSGGWQLPAANPFLRPAVEPPRAGLIRGQTSAHRGLRTFAQDRSRGRRDQSALVFSPALPGEGTEAAIYLRWRLGSAAPGDLQPRLERSLHPLQSDARQAGVELSFSAAGDDWLLKMTGVLEPMPAILQQALKTLSQPTADFWQEDETRPVEPPLMPIRQLLKALPEAWPPAQAQEESTVADAQSLQNVWASAGWDGLAVGLPASIQSAVSATLGKMPGTADNSLHPPLAARAQYRWQAIDTASSEQALLLFCPVPSAHLADEAAWRLLGQLCQTPFYQRLRVELQLGYAVFSTVRQLNGQTGLLFGVQSPNASLADILEHLQTFLNQLPDLIDKTDEATLAHQRQALAAQFDSTALPLAQAAELLWQSTLAGHPSDYLPRLQEAIDSLTHRDLLHASLRLNRAEGGWSCLASGPCPGEPWQAAR